MVRKIHQLPRWDHWGAVGALFSTQDGPFKLLREVCDVLEYTHPNLVGELGKDCSDAKKMLAIPLVFKDLGDVVRVVRWFSHRVQVWRSGQECTKAKHKHSKRFPRRTSADLVRVVLTLTKHILGVALTVNAMAFRVSWVHRVTIKYIKTVRYLASAGGSAMGLVRDSKNYFECQNKYQRVSMAPSLIGDGVVSRKALKKAVYSLNMTHISLLVAKKVLSIFADFTLIVGLYRPVNPRWLYVSALSLLTSNVCRQLNRAYRRQVEMVAANGV